MGFENLLGNDRLKKNLAESLARGHISHFYLISGPQGSGKKTLARLISAAVLCQGREKPCLSCAVCRKVMENNHPDVITVEDPEHKAVAVKIVRQIRDDVFIRPNESDHKIYIFPQELGTEGQNALLKILEEPPSHVLFLLTCEQRSQLLETVRSRLFTVALSGVTPSAAAAALHRQLQALFSAGQGQVYRCPLFSLDQRRNIGQGHAPDGLVIDSSDDIACQHDQIGIGTCDRFIDIPPCLRFLIMDIVRKERIADLMIPVFVAYTVQFHSLQI